MAVSGKPWREIADSPRAIFPARVSAFPDELLDTSEHHQGRPFQDPATTLEPTALFAVQYPAIYIAYSPSKQLLLGIPIDVIDESHRHSLYERDHPVQAATIFIMSLEPL